MIDKQLQFKVISFHEFESPEPINEANVKVKLVDINIPTFDNHLFELKFELLSGSRKGITLLDYIHYIPFKKMSWKMPKFLRSVGINESGEYNFNDLIGVELIVDLVVGESKQEEGRIFQNINYVSRNSIQKSVDKTAFVSKEEPVISKEVAEKTMNAPVKQRFFDTPKPEVKVEATVEDILYSTSNYISSDNVGLLSDDDLPF